MRCLDFDVTNEWFATGSTDRTIKYWDLASGKLKLSMTGHINTVRDVKISPEHTYLYSCSEDKTVRCWDLIQNKAIRNYHGHLSGVYTLAIHPTLNLLVICVDSRLQAAEMPQSDYGTCARSTRFTVCMATQTLCIPSLCKSLSLNACQALAIRP